MKKIFSIFIIIFSFLSISSSFSEQYICSYLYYGEPRSFTVKRINNNNFEQNSIGGKKFLNILYEDNDYLVLGNLLQYPRFVGYDVTFIDKISKLFNGYGVTEPNSKEKLKSNEGKCMVNN